MGAVPRGVAPLHIRAFVFWPKLSDMNLFCFTLEGSTESMYEPAYSPTVQEVRPKFQCSPALLRRRPEWGGSDPSINCSKSQSTKTKRNNVRSCFVTSALDNETIDIHSACWISSGDKKDLAHQKRDPDKDVCRTSEDTAKILGLKTDPMLQASKTAADTAESIRPRRLKKLQNLVPNTKGGQQSTSGKERSLSENYEHLTDVLSSYNPVLTCIGLGKKQKNPSAPSPSLLQPNLSHEHPEERVWSPLQTPCELCRPPQSCPETSHTFTHERWECSSALSLPRTAAWDRFETLIQELDIREPEPCLHRMARSITDLDFHQDEWSRFGRFDAFRQQWPLTMERETGRGCTMNPAGERNVTYSKQTEETSQKDSEPIKTGDTTAINVKQSGHRDVTKGHSASLESVYSSGQSSSSGVTSGSNCSSNRASLRLDEELSAPRTFCGRARVHTEFVPSPYDTESLKLQVGDVIDIISKPAMGTWTGILNNKIGYFKFIYVDLIKEETKSGDACIHELLKRFDLEEYALTLLLHGYQTAEDLVKLTEHHLIELKVTDPKHRQRLLSAVSSLHPLHPEEEVVYENMKNCPRDSGCGMVTPDDATEIHSPSEHSQTEVVTVC
ncbi:SAM domain-containing protein SAMSN-1b [Periophthalmus magnuspinnatus]|uniref:SAM domain-containing protein SAMSN-1b n=1 Tax=Periophthalmus magnuspinnatus TaxID=409849 RepID=UPI0024362C2B|nr:SAM domain-containing protein SAMSN-1b [Periophthalmus magnuspinnatus]